MKRIIILIGVLVVLIGFVSVIDRFSLQLAEYIQKPSSLSLPAERIKVTSEESLVIDVVKRVSPSVVTVATDIPQSQSAFDFGPFFFSNPEEEPLPQEDTPQDIGSGFIINTDGLIVTNKHVVSGMGRKYQVVTQSDKQYDVEKIYRDPFNDVAILKINPNQHGERLQPATLGDSSKLQAGQMAIAIGTALGEFRHTVTTGVISGLGRGIVAGSQFQGFVERLDDVIQTDAAINPGNSGGPLLNSSGQVIGINTAVAQSGQNIGFALPINLVKDSIKNFNDTGQFNRPYLGVSYQIITRDRAVVNELPEGAYIRRVVTGSAADKAGIKRGDIITKMDNEKVTQDNDIATIIKQKKVGDTIRLTVWRGGEENTQEGKREDITVKLEAAPDQ